MDLILSIVPPAVEAARGVFQAEPAAGGDITDDGLKFMAAALVMGIGAIGPALAIGNLVGRAMDALGRNPEAQPVIQTNMILGLAFAEAIGIYALVVAIMIGFVF
jgi:F-type H+-transporting ATPase subunit c